MTTLDTV